MAGNAVGAERESDPPAVPDGYTLIEGDVLVKTADLGKPRVRPYSTFQHDKLWPGGIVPYELDASVTMVPARVSAIQAAMALIVAAKWGSTIQFVPRTNQSDYIYYTNDASFNFSPVGKQGGKQEIHIFSWGSTMVICHETMHSLGFWHEQSRSDRDTYVTIHLENVCQTCCSGGSCDHNFQIESSSKNYGPYDFGSVMHYGKCDFKPMSLPCAGNETITVNQPWTSVWQDSIGRASQLSRMDQVTLSFLYSLGNWRFIDATDEFGGAGTFLNPWHDFSAGVTGTPSGGTLYMQPGTYTAFGSVSTPMRIEAPLGQVRVTGPMSRPKNSRGQ